MGEVVLEMMREEVTADLLEMAKLVDNGGKKYLVPLEDWGDIKSQQFRGCVLWWGKQSVAEGLERAEGNEQDSEAAPGLYGTFDLEGVQYGSKLPVHNLNILLGAVHLAKLQEASAIFRNTEMALLARVRTTRLQRALWRIQGYMAGKRAT